MRGVFLHVMGDALGNIGVIASALIIWLTHFPGRYYFDPGISLVITIIILYSAIPLCKAASRILLQAVPVGLSIDEITDDIESLPRVISAHHLHVWQLSDTKLVASLHVKVDCEVEGAGSASYMHLAREIRGCLHGYGIHSSTIQPEFTPQPDAGASSDAANGQLNPAQAANSSKAASVNSEGPTCLLECGDNCAGSKMCCPTDGKNGSQTGKK
jgi:zinc transporter 1